MTDRGAFRNEGQNLRDSSLGELSQELCRFSYGLARKFRCPVCFKDVAIDLAMASPEGDVITEEHILPKSVGGRHSSFLCKTCNSRFGHQQTRWLSEYISLVQGGAPFPIDPKRQRASATANGHRVGGSLRMAADGAIEFITDPGRSNPSDYEAQRTSPTADEVKISFSMPVFSNEASLRAGYLTAAYGMWFKSFGYSWVLQKSLEVVRQQILEPEVEILAWNFLIPERSESLVPSVGLAKFGETIFPVALIFDHIVILPTRNATHPPATNEVAVRWLELGPAIDERYRHRCLGPANFVCDGQQIIVPDMFRSTTVATETIEVKCWT